MDFHFEECDQQDPHKDDEAMTMSSTTEKKDGRAQNSTADAAEDSSRSPQPKTRRLLGEIFFLLERKLQNHGGWNRKKESLENINGIILTDFLFN